jgi:hypothetical protein
MSTQWWVRGSYACFYNYLKDKPCVRQSRSEHRISCGETTEHRFLPTQGLLWVLRAGSLLQRGAEASAPTLPSSSLVVSFPCYHPGVHVDAVPRHPTLAQKTWVKPHTLVPQSQLLEKLVMEKKVLVHTKRKRSLQSGLLGAALRSSLDHKNKIWLRVQ